MSDLISRQNAINAWDKLSKRGRTEFDQVLMTLPFAEPKAGWIPVGKKLPKDNDCVLATRDGTWELGICESGTWSYWTDSHWEETDMVTAWMPLPEPYREDGEDE